MPCPTLPAAGLARSTQNQAVNAIVSLYRAVLRERIEDLGPLVRAKKARRLPGASTRPEVETVLDRLENAHRLAAELMYGAGLRALECVRLRIEDIEFARSEIVVRDTKGQSDRVTILPERTRQPLWARIALARAIHDSDLRAGFGSFIFQRPSRESTAARIAIGAGRTYFRPGGARATPAVASCDASISAIRRRSVR